MLYQLSYISTYLERAAGIEPASSAWKAEVIAIIRCPHELGYLTLISYTCNSSGSSGV
ncbi:hypothetical protein XSR1_890005 [Xenorhabdus szentirmaii DSM 16338]|uniref:Uncharacterized protein n=1 Tax=Xenorhabdus szentirmaii DSM 16338 TaxID=1427518 RepID=W1J4J0_9GAMM|nr:hypothetical protein XSR1_890005 [Xenorhabdus szentirmaii DSM 16338]